MQTSRKIPMSIWVILGLFLLLISIPYIYSWFLAGNDRVFGGFLLNPIDGNSYFAKMMLGWTGQWEFHLLYSSQYGDGSPLFLFYIFLGHTARWFGLSIPLVFQIARLIGAISLFFAGYHLSLSLFPQSEVWAKRLLLLLTFGSGMGWILLTTGSITSDFWVAEAYPFLSAYSNPHFCFGLAISIEILLRYRSVRDLNTVVLIGFLALLESVIMPFEVILCGAIGGLLFLVDVVRKKAISWKWLLAVGIGGGIFVLYQYYITSQDALLNAWNAQNNTASPAIWDFILSFSPVLILAGIQLCRKKDTNSPIQEIMAAWIVAAFILIFIPFNLQRRFLLGFYIPCATLAVMFVHDLFMNKPKQFKWLYPTLLALSLPTNLLVITAGMNPQNISDSVIYPSRDLLDGLTWLRDNVTDTAVALSHSDVGLFVPAYSGMHVVYGHPFETIHAEETELLVNDIYAGSYSNEEVTEILEGWNVDWVIIDQSNPNFEAQLIYSGWQPVFEQGNVNIYSYP